MHHEQGNNGHMDPSMVRKHYVMLGVMAVVMTAMMYFVMFSMIYSGAEFIQNINFFYMAIEMAMPMIVLMPLMMKMMYPDRKLNLLVYVGSVILFVLAFLAVRSQALVGDRQFLRSMIPHHSGAILMCERAKIRDPEIQDLCQQIIASQKQEIAQMKDILARK
jgi:hypothetical protein